VQILGGHGYIAEWGLEQFARDARITTIYEGTTQIQALDLLGRKILGGRGQGLGGLMEDLIGRCELAAKDEALRPAAEKDMMSRLRVSKLDAGAYAEEFVFKSYYANELISGRVCKNGNKALFFEPLIANSIFLYIYALRLIFDHVASGQDARRSNVLFVKAVQQMEDVISYYYRGGSTFPSEFWKLSAQRSRERLEKRKEFSDYMRVLRELKKQGRLHAGPAYGFSPHTWQVVDSQMGYGYLDSEPAP
jgi:hypothetical protein